MQLLHDRDFKAHGLLAVLGMSAPDRERLARAANRKCAPSSTTGSRLYPLRIYVAFGFAPATSRRVHLPDGLPGPLQDEGLTGGEDVRFEIGHRAYTTRSLGCLPRPGKDLRESSSDRLRPASSSGWGCIDLGLTDLGGSRGGPARLRWARPCPPTSWTRDCLAWWWRKTQGLVSVLRPDLRPQRPRFRGRSRHRLPHHRVP
jgi:hypothetical protein